LDPVAGKIVLAAGGGGIAEIDGNSVGPAGRRHDGERAGVSKQIEETLARLAVRGHFFAILGLVQKEADGVGAEVEPVAAAQLFGFAPRRGGWVNAKPMEVRGLLRGSLGHEFAQPEPALVEGARGEKL